MDIKPTSYRYDGEGIECAYRNEKWVVCIKNWKPNNDIDGLEHLEIHHTTDEQFILISGKCIIITADRIDGKFNIELTPVEKGTLYNVPKERWQDQGPAVLRLKPGKYVPLAGGKREKIVEVMGRTKNDIQVPYLVDPNTGVELFESEAIVKYLQKQYGD